ncbi:MAG: ribonuclease domain-containing protein [Wenzhouxiangella sp.]
MKKLLLLLLAGWLVLANVDWFTEQAWWPGTFSGASSESSLLVRGVEVRDLDGRVAWRGDVDIGNALARIERGERDPHRNDGGVFHNRERRLPDRPSGYYREYVIRTPGISHAGPQRLVIGRDGEVFYTSDHYRSFRRVR